MRILVTGADGFVGRHLCRHLKDRGDEVLEVFGPRAKSVPPSAFQMDVTDAAGVATVIKCAEPQGLINLAGFSSVARAEQEPFRPWLVNAVGTLNILAAIRDCAPRCRVLLVGSGEMYGLLEPQVPATEEMPVRPTGAYGSSKVAAEIAGFQFYRGYSIPVISARPFNQLGRGQDPRYAVPTFASQIEVIRKGRAEPVIKAGNLAAVRDFLHVEDTVAAYRLLLGSGQPGSAYNICSGTGRTLRSILDEMLQLAEVKARIELDPSRLRPGEIPSLVGNGAKLFALGWRPKKTVTAALREVLEEYRHDPTERP